MANLLPSSNSAIIKYQKSAVVNSDKFLNVKTNKTQVNRPNKRTDLLEDIITKIEKKVIKIDKILKNSLLLSKKENEKKRVKKEQEKFGEREKELEKKKPKSEKGIKLPSPPKMGFLDWIKNFITQTILGFFAVRLIEFLPQLLKILPVIISFSDFVVDWGGKLLDGLVTFIDWGYKTYDATRGFVKNLFGENGVKQFDQLSGLLNKFLNLAIIAGMVAAGSGGFGGKVSKGGKPGGGGRPTITTSGGGVYGRPDIRNPLRQKPTITTSGGGVSGRPNIRNPLRQRPTITTSGGDKRLLLSSVRPFLKNIPLPVVGALIDFGLSVALGENPGRAAFRAIGAGLLSALGAAVGSVVPVAGNIIGGIIGGIAGDLAGGALYDLFFGGKLPKKSQSNKLSGGGTPKVSSRSRKPVSRTIKKKKPKRTVSFTPRKIKPGQNTGGENKVQSVFPNPEKPAWWDPLGLFTGKNKQEQDSEQPKKPKGKTVNPQKFLVDSNDELGRADFFGPFFTIALKTVLGQKPDFLDYKNAGRGLNSWMQTTFKSGPLGFAGGGEVEAQGFFSGEDYTNVIAKSVENSVTKEVDTTIRNLSKELSLRPVGREEMIQKNIKDAQEFDGSGEGVSEGGISGTGVDKGVSVAKKLIADLGITPAQAAGIVGNFLYESAGMNPGEREGAPYGTPEKPPALGTVGVGYGWAQWTNSRPGDRLDKFLKSYGGDKGKIATDDDNYRFLMKELRGDESLSKKGVITGTYFPKDDPQAASDWFRRNWERAGVPADEKRRKETLAVYNKIKGLTREQAKAEVAKSGGKIIVGKGEIMGSKSVRSVDDFTPIARRFGLTLYSSYRKGDTGYHGSDRARDYSNDGVGLGTKEQLNFARYVYQNYGAKLKELIYTPLGFGVKNGKKVPLTTWGPVTKSKWAGGGTGTNASHYDHVHVAYEEGGFTHDKPHPAVLGEKGTEFVVDAEQTQAIERTFPGLLNSLVGSKYKETINVLRNFVEYEAPYAEPEIVEIIVEVPVPMPMGSQRDGAIIMVSNKDIDNDRFDILTTIG